MRIKYLAAVVGIAAAVTVAVVLSKAANRTKPTDRTAVSATNATQSVAKGRRAQRRAAARLADGTNGTSKATAKKIDPATVNPDDLDDDLLKKTVADLRKMLNEEWKDRYKRVKIMQTLLDKGDQASALHEARELRFSGDKGERLAAVGVFGWVGPKALAELTEMLVDPEPEVADEAYEKWEMAFNELESDDFRCEIILEAAKTFEDEARLYSMMMELAKIGGDLAKDTLKQVSNGDSTEAAKRVADDLYNHLFGEIFVDPENWNPTMKRLQAQRDAELKAQAAAEAQEAQKQLNEGESP